MTEIKKLFVPDDLYKDFERTIIKHHIVAGDKNKIEDFKPEQLDSLIKFGILCAMGDYIDEKEKKPGFRGKYEMKNESKHCGWCGKKFIRGETVSTEPYPRHPYQLPNGECFIDPYD